MDALSSLSFSAPAMLWALLALPLAVAAYVLAQRRRARYAVRFTNVELLASLLPRRAAWKRHVPPSLALLSLGALLLGLARPQAEIPVPKEQATIVMVMDTSGSMAARDVQPTRMAAAQAAGKSFLDVLPRTFRIALVSFASTATTVVRPTTDRAVVRQSLDALYAEGGTAMGDALQRAVELGLSVRNAPPASPTTPTAPAAPATPTAPAAAGMATPGATPAPGGEPAPVAILLLSDGANTDGRTQPLAAARAARAAGIPVFAIALGTEGGVLEMPGIGGIGGLPGSQIGGRRGPTRTVSVPPDEATLRQIAEITGGRFFSAPSARELQSVYAEIGSYVGFEHERQEVTFAFGLAGAVLLASAGVLALAWSSRFP